MDLKIKLNTNITKTFEREGEEMTYIRSGMRAHHNFGPAS